jgi:hypothetical protein
MRVLRAVIEIPMLAMLHARQDLPLGGPIAFARIGDDHPGDVLTALEEFTEKRLGGLLVPPPLHQDIEHHAVLIDCPPEVGTFLVDRDEDRIQMPCVTRPGASPPKLMGVLLAERAAPLADRLLRDDDTTDEQDLFHIARAERKAAVPPNGVADNLPREPMVLVEIGRGWGCHNSSIQRYHRMRRAHASPEELRGWHEYAMVDCGCIGAWLSCQRPPASSVTNSYDITARPAPLSTSSRRATSSLDA